jgi:hypothetical protein
MSSLPARPAPDDRRPAAIATAPSADQGRSAVEAVAPAGHDVPARDAALDRMPAREPAPSSAMESRPGAQDAGDPRTTCTQAQLRRFIKSRPWIPMHELRRRFGIPGGDDEVTPVRAGAGTIFVGLPSPEGRMLGELLTAGDVGYELSLDPDAPIVVGVYPMRPVPRG